MNDRVNPPAARTRLRLAVTGSVALAVGLAGAVLPIAAPAADAASPSCGLYYFCGWHDAGYVGTRWAWGGASIGGDHIWRYVGAAANDQISSYDDRVTAAYVYIAKNCPADGLATYITPGAHDNLAPDKWQDGTTINDSISAWSIGLGGEGSPTSPQHGSRTAGGC